MKKKYKYEKSLGHYYKKGGIEAGLVKGSFHPRNNIHLRFIKRSGKFEGMDLTVDEAGAVISCLGAAIMDYTFGKREMLKP